MTDLLALTDALQQGDVRCTECGCNPVVIDPTTGRHVLLDAIVRQEDGRFVARCKGC